MAVLGGEICAIEDGRAFVALKAVKMIVDIMDQEAVIRNPSLTLKTKLQWNLLINIVAEKVLFSDISNVFVLEAIVFWVDGVKVVSKSYVAVGAGEALLVEVVGARQDSVTFNQLLAGMALIWQGKEKIQMHCMYILLSLIFYV